MRPIAEVVLSHGDVIFEDPLSPFHTVKEFDVPHYLRM